MASSVSGIGEHTMRAVHLIEPGGPDALRLEQAGIPIPADGEALVRVHAAAITRDELTWPTDRLPAIPSYELSGTVAALAGDADGLSVGDRVFALTPFDRDGAAADFVAVPANVLAPKPETLDHVASATVPLAALSAWQGLFDHGGLRQGQRVLIHGASGDVGRYAVQLARWRGAVVIGTVSAARVDEARRLGVHEVVDRDSVRFEDVIEPVDLVFDTVGGEALSRSPAVLRGGGRLVTIADEPPEGVDAVYFVVEPNRDQLVELADLVDRGVLSVAIDSVFPLSDAPAAFERSLAAGKRGKVVLRVLDEDGDPAAGADDGSGA